MPSPGVGGEGVLLKRHFQSHTEKKMHFPMLYKALIPCPQASDHASLKADAIW